MPNFRNSNQSYTGLVEKYIGSAYDNVKRVADNLAEVIAVGKIKHIEKIVPNIAAAEHRANAAYQSAIDSAASARESEIIADAFNDFYLGPYISEPTTDNDGKPLVVGALYLDRAVSPNIMMYWDSIRWQVSYATLQGLSHGDLDDLDLDEHKQYLNDARHTAITGNPHSTIFSDITDTPASYTGHASKVVIVNPSETGLDFLTLSQNYLPITGGDLQGNLRVNGAVSATAPPNAPADLTRKDYVDTFIPLTGGLISGEIVAPHRISTVQNGTDPVTGFVIYASYVGASSLIQGALSWDNRNTAVSVWQKGTGAVGSPDTELRVVNGKARLIALNGLDNLAVSPNDLTTKAFTDANYLTATGNAKISGNLDVAGHTSSGLRSLVTLPAGATESAAFAIMDGTPTGNILGALSVNYADKLTLHVDQAGASYVHGAPETRLSLRHGRVSVVSPKGEPTVPLIGADLANKLYVDNAIASSLAQAGGLVAALKAAQQGQFSSIDTTFTTNDGKTVTVRHGVIISVV